MNKKIISVLILIIALSSFGIYQYKKSKDEESVIPALEDTASDIIISDIYAFATTATAKNGAAFLKIINNGNNDDELIEAKSDIADITEIHENIIDADTGRMMMRKINTLTIPMDETTLLQPKGHHIMFLNLKSPLTSGEHFPLTLIFENAGEKIINVEIIDAGTTPDDNHHDHNDGHGHHH